MSFLEIGHENYDDFYGPSVPTADSSRAVVNKCRKYVFLVLVNCLGGLSLPRNSASKLTNCALHDLDSYDWAVKSQLNQNK